MAPSWMNTHTPLRLMLTLAAAWAFAGCAPDEDPITPELDIIAPDLGDVPDADAPDTGPDAPDAPDTTRPDMGERDLGGDAGSDMGDCTADCGDGSCILDEAGAEICLCDSPFTGAECGECLRGYTGDACDECAAGFIADPVVPESCIPDPCAGDPCGANSTCSVELDPTTGVPAAECACEPGFEGDACDTCAEGYTGADCDSCDTGYFFENGLCVLLVCSPFPCGDHGICRDDGAGDSTCICDLGWTGRDCGTCAVGYILESGACVPDACAGLACDHGICVTPVGAAAMCECDTGYTGAACDTCDVGFTEVVVGSQTVCLNTLPVRDSRLLGWFDGMRADQIDLVSGDLIWSWWPSGGAAFPFVSSTNDATRPRYVLLPKPGVSFDGNDYMANLTELYGDTATDFTAFAIVTWNYPGNVITLFNTKFYDPMYMQNVVRVLATGAGYASFTSSGAAIEHYNFATTGPRMLRWSRHPFGNAIAHSLSSGGTDTTTWNATVGPPIPNYNVLMGGTSNATPGASLVGTMHEVVFIEGTLTTAERDAIEAYLSLKWGL